MHCKFGIKNKNLLLYFHVTKNKYKKEKERKNALLEYKQVYRKRNREEEEATLTSCGIVDWTADASYFFVQSLTALIPGKL